MTQKQMVAVPQPPEAGEYELVLLDASGGELGRTQFAVYPLDHMPAIAQIAFSVPMPGALSRQKIVKDGSVIYEP